MACVTEAFLSAALMCIKGVLVAYQYSAQKHIIDVGLLRLYAAKTPAIDLKMAQMIFSYTAFSTCVSDRWQLAIGDPNIIGWAICTAYALAAILAVIVLRAAPFRPAHRSREQILWSLIACLTAALALNKQLDLQSLMLAVGHCLAQEQGWYENRRLVQRDFIFALIAVAAIGGAAIIWLLRGIVRHNLNALLGLAAFAGFILIRAGHLFHMFVPDQLATDILLHHLTTLLEAVTPVLIIAAAWKLLGQARSQADLTP